MIFDRAISHVKVDPTIGSTGDIDDPVHAARHDLQPVVVAPGQPHRLAVKAGLTSRTDVAQAERLRLFMQALGKAVSSTGISD